MSVKVNNTFNIKNLIRAIDMEPLTYYLVEDSGSTIHSKGDLILTSHKGVGRTYQTIGKTIWTNEYDSDGLASLLVREVDVEVNITGYTH